MKYFGIPSVIMRKLRGRGVPAFFMLLGSLYAATAAVSKEEKHSDPSRSCVSSECHPAVMKHKYLHGPLKLKIVGQCTVCHSPLPGSEHKFKLVETEEKLCLTCHRKVVAKGQTLHEPVAKGECLGCHSPHGSEEPHQVRKTPAVKLCNECHHKKPVMTRKYPHTPAGKGECLSCHRPHGTMAKKLLEASGRQLCLEKCHEKMRPVRADGTQRKIHLEPEDCTKCHGSHDSNYPSLLTRSPDQLCLDGCHKEVKEDIGSSKFKHDPMTKGLACVECHRAHDNRFGQLLRKPAADLCFGCHEKLQNQITAAKFKHRPVADKGCRSCHQSHTSEFGKLLFADYPTETASAYDPAQYAFCFSCHDEKVVRERDTDKITDFRNGRLNLHYLHVNKERNGLTCRTCHTEHAGTQPKQIIESVLFGSWKLPVKFTKNNTGGSCLTGCHKEFSYDRVNPVQLSAR